ncbi:MAG: hypothetical protein WBM09_04720 [Gallionella sp.]
MTSCGIIEKPIYHQSISLEKIVMKILLAGGYLQQPVKIRPVRRQATIRSTGFMLPVAAHFKPGGDCHG